MKKRIGIGIDSFILFLLSHWESNLKEVKPYTVMKIGRILSNSKFLSRLRLSIFFFLFSCSSESIQISPNNWSESVFDLERSYIFVEKKEATDFQNMKSIPEANWQSFETKTLGFERNDGKALWVKFKPTVAEKLRSPVLYAEIALEEFEVYQNGEKIYDFYESDYVFPHIISLKSSNSEIYIRFFSHYKGYVGMDRKVEIRDHSDALVQLFTDNFAETFLAPVLLVLSFIFSGFFLLRKREKIFLYFAILLVSAAFIQGLNGFVGFSLKKYSYILIPFLYVNFALFPFFILLFLNQIFPPFFRSLFRILSVTHILVFVVSIVKNMETEISFLNSEYDYNWLLILEAGITILSSIYVLFKGERHLRLVTIGIFCLVVAGTHDTMVDQEILSYKIRILSFGFWTMIGLFAIFVFRHYSKILTYINKVNLELSEKNKELERLIVIDKDLTLAKALQSSLLSTKFKEDEKIRVIGFSQTLESVGGDYFDHTKDSLGNWAILMTDVSGHGISSALVAAMSKMAFAGASAYLQYPSRVFQLMNRHLVGKTKNLFITASYIFIDTESNELSFSNAGHPGFFLIRPLESEVLRFNTKGKPLGLFAETEFSERTISVFPGDRILMYTDGILELLNENEEMFGEDRIKKLLWENRFQNIQSLSSILQDAFYRFSNGWKYQMDDLSYLLIEII